MYRRSPTMTLKIAFAVQIAPTPWSTQVRQEIIAVLVTKSRRRDARTVNIRSNVSVPRALPRRFDTLRHLFSCKGTGIRRSQAIH